jgi:hypothetical protein
MNIVNFDNDVSIDTTFTGLRGYIETTYDQLVEAFGDPMYVEDRKSTSEWRLEFEVEDEHEHDYVVATIYDWKTNNSTPYGKYQWHIGGNSRRAVDCVYNALENV